MHAHDAEPDLSGLQGHLLDFRDRETVAVDDIVQENRCGPYRLLEPVKIDRVAGDEFGQIDRAEIAAFVGQQPLLTAGVGGLERTQMRGRVVFVGTVDEEHTRFTVEPGQINDLIENFARLQFPYRITGGRFNQLIGAIRFERLHEDIGQRHAEVEIVELVLKYQIYQYMNTY